jgi:hypothetical protein
MAIALGVGLLVGGGAIAVSAASSSGQGVTAQGAMPAAFLESLTRVPAASCLHDAQPYGATRVVVSPVNKDGAGNAAYAPVGGSPESDPGAASLPSAPPVSRRARGTSVRAAEAIYACTLHSYPPEIISVGGNYKARGTGRNTCVPPVAHMETYVTLLDLISTGWRNLSIASDSRTNGTVTLTTPLWDCNHTTTRTYRTQTEGYALLAGTLYYNVDKEDQNHTCPG